MLSKIHGKLYETEASRLSIRPLVPAWQKDPIGPYALLEATSILYPNSHPWNWTVWSTDGKKWTGTCATKKRASAAARKVLRRLLPDIT